MRSALFKVVLLLLSASTTARAGGRYTTVAIGIQDRTTGGQINIALGAIDDVGDLGLSSADLVPREEIEILRQEIKDILSPNVWVVNSFLKGQPEARSGGHSFTVQDFKNFLMHLKSPTCAEARSQSHRRIYALERAKDDITPRALREGIAMAKRYVTVGCNLRIESTNLLE